LTRNNKAREGAENMQHLCVAVKRKIFAASNVSAQGLREENTKTKEMCTRAPAIRPLKAWKNL